jgi:hypothetical protein
MDALGGTVLRPRRTMPRTICLTEASGCSAETEMSRSLIARTRGQSVLDAFEEDRLLMFRRLAQGNDANYAGGLGVDDGDHELIENTQCDEAMLGILEAIVFVGIGGTLKDSLGVGKIEAVLLDIQLALRITPCEPLK